MEGKMSLCPLCTHCPEVEIVGDEVRIGEDSNLAVLKPQEWNVLVNLIQSGQLTTIWPRGRVASAARPLIA